MKLPAKLRFLGFFLAFLALLRIKSFKHGLFATKLGIENYLVYVIVLKWLESISIVICLKLRAKFPFKVFFSVFGTFLHKVFQTWFVWHETWDTLLFDIYYCVEIVKIKKDSQMFEITC